VSSAQARPPSIPSLLADSEALSIRVVGALAPAVVAQAAFAKHGAGLTSVFGQPLGPHSGVAQAAFAKHGAGLTSVSGQPLGPHSGEAQAAFAKHGAGFGVACTTRGDSDVAVSSCAGAVVLLAVPGFLVRALPGEPYSY
jgi:hypothetical protein